MTMKIVKKNTFFVIFVAFELELVIQLLRFPPELNINIYKKTQRIIYIRADRIFKHPSFPRINKQKSFIFASLPALGTSLL